jgi:hypothetical protein
MDINDLDPAVRLAVSVIRRCLAGEAINVPSRIMPRYANAFHRCHENVRDWVSRAPEYAQVYGFLVADRRPFSDGTLVIAHSVVRAPDGSLHDITPNELEISYSFVPHAGTPQEFELIGDAVNPDGMVEVPHSLLYPLLRDAGL